MKMLLDHDGIDQTLRKLAREIAAAAPADVPVAVVGIRRRGETLVPRGRTVLCERDRLTIIGEPAGLAELAKRYDG